MALRFKDAEGMAFPDDMMVANALAPFGLSSNRILETLRSFVSVTEFVPNSRYTEKLASELEKHLRRALVGGDIREAVDGTYSPRLNERADLVLATRGKEERLFFEIEFRPNVEKDLIKFQIGHNARRLAAAVLLLSSDRDSINPGYTTMPEFGKFVELIRELGPSYPLFVCGVTGQHFA